MWSQHTYLYIGRCEAETEISPRSPRAGAVQQKRERQRLCLNTVEGEDQLPKCPLTSAHALHTRMINAYIYFLKVLLKTGYVGVVVAAISAPRRLRQEDYKLRLVWAIE